MKRRIFALLCALAAVLCACSFAPPEDEPEDDAQLPWAGEDTAQGDVQPVRALPQSPVLPLLDGITIDPVDCPDGVQQTVGALVYEGLFAPDENFAVQNVLCESYTYDASKRTYRFTLRDDATFSDGSRLRASDVLATYRRAAESARYGERFAFVSSMRVSSGVLIITLTRDDATFPALLDIPVVRAGSEERLFPLGTGRYVPVQDEDGTLSLQRRDGADEALPARIDLCIVKDNDAAAYRFSTGEVNLLVSDLTDDAAASSATAVDRADADTTRMIFLGFNTAHAALSRSAVRRALSLGIDREAAAEKLFAGHALGAEFAVSPCSALYPASLAQGYSSAAYDRALAALDLGEGTAMTLLVNEENTFRVALGRWLCGELSRGTLTVTLRAVPWDEYVAALENGDFDLYLGEVKLGANWDVGALVRERVVTTVESAESAVEEEAEPQEIVSGGTLNYGGYRNANSEALLDEYLAAPDAQHLAALWQNLSTNVPFAPVLFKRVTLLTPEGFVEGAAPTAGDPFAHFERWTLHLAAQED